MHRALKQKDSTQNVIYTAVYSSLLKRKSIWYRFATAAASMTPTPDVHQGEVPEAEARSSISSQTWMS